MTGPPRRIPSGLADEVLKQAQALLAPLMAEAERCYWANKLARAQDDARQFSAELAKCGGVAETQGVGT